MQFKIEKGFEQTFLQRRYANTQHHYSKRNANQNHKKIHLTAIRTATENGKCCQGCAEIAIFAHFYWKCKMVWLLWRTEWWVSIKFKHRITIWSSNFTAKPILKRIKSRHSDTCTSMFTAVLLTIARRWQPHKHPPTDEWTKKTDTTVSLKKEWGAGGENGII